MINSNSRVKNRKRRHYEELKHGHGSYCSKGTSVMMRGGHHFLHLSSPAAAARQKLFDKVITNSDIKQYRFAIPKHQATRHFPVGGTSDISSSRGALLCMEDNIGKLWQFNYTFWRSCQGYVLTKEWSQFVKEKRLGAGDVVSFLQSTGPDKRLYIDYCKPAINAAKPELGESQTVKLFGVNISSN